MLAFRHNGATSVKREAVTIGISDAPHLAGASAAARFQRREWIVKKLVLALVVLGALAFANEPARAQNCTSYQTTGPYYATPSWDQQLVYFERFICLTNWNNQAVLDRETGLVWQRAPFTHVTGSSDFSQSDAVLKCQNANIGGRGGWRLPAPEELMSLVDFTQSNPALPLGHPFQGVNGRYWTPSMHQASRDTSPNAAISFLVTSGQTDVELIGDPMGAWCVRGGSHVLTIFAAPPV
jgi:hypothetical protein